MSSYTNDTGAKVKVLYRTEGKFYGSGQGEGDVVDTAERTTYPFEEVVVEAGATVDLGEVSWKKVVDMSVEVPAGVDPVQYLGS